MCGYCWDTYYTQLELEYQAGCRPGEHRPATELPIPLGWVLAWVGSLSTISFALGNAIKWLVQ